MIGRWAHRLVNGCATLAVAGAVATVVLDRTCPFPVDSLTHRASSAVVTDRTGQSLLRIVGPDDQWREPVPLSEMGPWISAASIAAEDERFWSHGGVDPIAILRAVGQNLGAGRVVSGASTITMQLARMCEPRERTFGAKAVQAFRAAQIERSLTKAEILEHYLNMAPYGGNIRGIEAAARRYFAKRAADLTLAEAALLAGLPKSPERLRPDRHLEGSRQRRDWVLGRMLVCGSITSEQWGRAVAEPVVLCREAEPVRAPHAAWLAIAARPQGGRTSIDLSLQTRLEQIVAAHAKALPDQTQVAAAVVDIASGQLLCLVGCTDPTDPRHGQVDGATAFRSPGSSLKPLIYAAAMDAGVLNAESTVHDFPIRRSGWSPANFSRGFSGEVPAAEALRRSLNIPAILIAEGLGLERSVRAIEAAGVRFRSDAARRGGLGTVVGAVEVRLLDLINAYATLGRGGIYRDVALFLDAQVEQRRVLSTDACAAVSDILSCRHRAPRGMESRAAEQLPWFCWKTGTSSGRRDAWAVGHNGRVAAGVWVGDFTGRGRMQYLGAEAAEPILADLLTVPALAAERDPPPPAAVIVRKPLPRPIEASPELRIIAPARNAEYHSIRGVAVIEPRCTAGEQAQWFLNGVLLSDGTRLELAPGIHELRCVGSGGVDAVRVTVR